MKTRVSLFLLVFTLLFMLFQNMSLDGVFPANPKSTSMGALGSEIIRHNFAGRARKLESRLKKWTSWESGSSENSSETSLSEESESTSSTKVRVGFQGRDRIGVAVSNYVTFKCEYSALDNLVQLRIDKELAPHSTLSFQHRTDEHQSSLNFIYNW